jgi:hypothetical protein
MACPSHSPRVDYSNYTWRTICAHLIMSIYKTTPWTNIINWPRRCFSLRFILRRRNQTVCVSSMVSSAVNIAMDVKADHWHTPQCWTVPHSRNLCHVVNTILPSSHSVFISNIPICFWSQELMVINIKPRNRNQLHFSYEFTLRSYSAYSQNFQHKYSWCSLVTLVCGVLQGHT